MTGVTEVLWLGMLLGVGAALSVGPIFVVIVQQAATSGFAACFRVILGSATADLVLLVPALAYDLGPATWWPARLAGDRRGAGDDDGGAGGGPPDVTSRAEEPVAH